MKKKIIFILLIIFCFINYLHAQSPYFGFGWVFDAAGGLGPKSDFDHENISISNIGTGPAFGLGKNNLGLNVAGIGGLNTYGLNMYWYAGIFTQLYYYNAFSLGLGVAWRNGILGLDLTDEMYLNFEISTFLSKFFDTRGGTPGSRRKLNPKSDWRIGLYCDYFPTSNDFGVGLKLTYASNYGRVWAYNDFHFSSYGTISDYNGRGGAIVIPTKLNGANVSIGNGALRRKNITNVTFEWEIDVGRNAFSDNQITNITIWGKSKINANAFSNNPLTNVIIQGNVNILENAFISNPINEISIMKNIDSIPNNAFPNNFTEAVKCKIANFGSMIGKYSYRDGQWFVDDKPIEKIFINLSTSIGVIIEKIDGVRPHAFNGGYYVKPGWHTVEVHYYKEEKEEYGRKIRRVSTDSVIFEQRYFFDETDYIITGTEIGDSIIFRIDKK